MSRKDSASSDEEVIREKGFPRFLVWKLKQSFPKRTPEEFEIEFEKFVNMDTPYKVYTDSQMTEVLDVVISTKQAPVIVDVNENDENAVDNMLEEVLKDWYVTWHGSLDEGLSVLRKFFSKQKKARVEDILQRPLSHLKFIKFVFEEVFVRKCLRVDVVKDRQRMDFAVHFASYVTDTFSGSSHQDDAENVLGNAILRYRKDWAQWLIGIIGPYISRYTEAFRVPEVPKEFLPYGENRGMQTVVTTMFLLAFIREHKYKACSDHTLNIQIWITNEDTTTVKLSSENNLSRKLNECPFNTFVLPVTISDKSNNANNHSNIILLQKDDMTIEHFEPHGSSNEFRQKYPQMYSQVEQLFQRLLPGWTYISPITFCPKIAVGPQEMEQRLRFGHKGYCAMWSLYYVVLRLLNPDKTREDTYEYMTTHPGILFDIRRFRCYVFDVAFEEIKNERRGLLR